MLRVAVARLPRLSNFTDLDALAAEPGVLVRYVTRPEELADADLVVLPGTRATVADLAWLRETGLADAVLRHAAAGGAGARHLRRPPDARPGPSPTTSSRGPAPCRASGCCPPTSGSRAEKTLGRPAGHGPRAAGATATRSTTGSSTVDDAAEPFLDGARAGSVVGARPGTARWRTTASAAPSSPRSPGPAGRRFVPAPDTDFAAVREARLDRLGDLVAEHADTDGAVAADRVRPPPGLPLLPPGATAGLTRRLSGDRSAVVDDPPHATAVEEAR